MKSKRGGALHGCRLKIWVKEKKQILRKPLNCTWELNTYSAEQTTDLLCISVVVGELYLGLIHVSCVTSHFSSSQRVQLCIAIIWNVFVLFLFWC
jgi:hypothetical protein